MLLWSPTACSTIAVQRRSQTTSWYYQPCLICWSARELHRALSAAEGACKRKLA